MSFDIQSIVQSKKQMRRQLSARPIEEKLQMLDALRERTLALQNNSDSPKRVPVARLAAAQAALENSK